jgi:putative ABC transport system ATP-binding protein
VALPLAIGGCSANDARRQAGRLLDSVGLTHRRRHRPHELSGGEQQRVALARALVIEPLLLLIDEPTGNLDSIQGDKIMTLLRQVVAERRQTLLMVTHDAHHAALADRIVYLRDGRIVEESLDTAVALSLRDPFRTTLFPGHPSFRAAA